jgi:hypothetical protein
MKKWKDIAVHRPGCPYKGVALYETEENMAKYHSGYCPGCNRPVATSESSEDTIFLIDWKTGKTLEIATGANPVFVRSGSAIVFERWANRWSDKASSNLWILELKPGVEPRRIITNVSEPAGVMLRK